MELEMSNRVEGYIQLLERVRASVKDDATAIAIIDQVGKDFRVERMRSNGQVSTPIDSAAATSKQIAFLARLGVPVSAGISSRKRVS